MKVFNSPNIERKFKGSAIAIGNFDGIHIGHKKVFKETKAIAKKNKIKFGVLTFTPLPVMFFNKKIKNFRITSEKQKLEIFKKQNVDFVVNIKFNRNFSKINAEDFIKKILYKKIQPKLLAVSKNFKFGRNRQGNVNLLKRFEKNLNYRLLNIKPLQVSNSIVSSTKIRKYLRNGKVNLANKLLSRTWSVEGKVNSGKKLGRKLGFRTCNVNIKNYILPKSGIYAVRVLIQNKNIFYKGISYLGARPTFGGKKVFLETNIFNINKNLYKKRIRVFFVKFLRNDKKFKNSVELVKQMNKDVIFAKKGLKTKLVL